MRKVSRVLSAEDKLSEYEVLAMQPISEHSVNVRGIADSGTVLGCGALTPSAESHKGEEMSTGQITTRMLLQRGLDSWKEARGLTFDLLEHLSDVQLTIPFPRPVFNSFGKQFQEMGVIQGAYVDAIEKGRMDFSKMSVEFDSDLVSSKERIHEFLTQMDAELENVLAGEQDPTRIIDWSLPQSPTLLEHIHWLIQHETLHHGQLAVFCYMLNITIPESWVETWAFPESDSELVHRWFGNWREYVG